MKPITREWLFKAEEDRNAVKTLLTLRPSFPSIICFHCQQAVEKYLRSLLQEVGHHIPKIRDLEELIARLSTDYPSLKSFRRSVKPLTEFAVEFRYPGATATRRRAVSARKTVERVRAEVRGLLGLRRRP
jgi:HEPN domain-containing protein